MIKARISACLIVLLFLYPIDFRHWNAYRIWLITFFHQILFNEHSIDTQEQADNVHIEANILSFAPKVVLRGAVLLQVYVKSKRIRREAVHLLSRQMTQVIIV